MPIYTYKCRSCNNEFYEKEALFAKPMKYCPKCINGVVRRVPPLPVVIFKGPGWYSGHIHTPETEPATLEQSNN